MTIRENCNEILFSQGEIYVHEKDGVSAGGTVDDGDCGVKIKEVHDNHRGLWTCR